MSLPPPSSIPRKSNRRHWNAEALHTIVFLVRVTFVLLLCGSSYLAGSIIGHNLSPDSNLNHGERRWPPIRTNMGVAHLFHGEASDLSRKQSGSPVDCKMTDEQLIELHVRRELEEHRHQGKREESSSQTRRFPSSSMGKSLNGVARVKKDDINEFFDFGNPVEGGDTSKEDALVFYQMKQALPSSDKFLAHSAEYDDGMGIPLTDSKTATENCNTMNVIFTGNTGITRKCTAIIGNFESYHVQRWMKVDTVLTTPIKSELPLVPVSRGYGMSPKGKGKGHFYAPPSPSDGKLSPVKKHWERLLPFFRNIDSVLEDLHTMLKKIARNNAVVVMTCNMGQSALLMNFACSARRKGFDLGNILVFPSDVETKEIAEGLGLATYYDVKNMERLPKGEARRYGDRIFTAMMYAKVLCVLYPLLLGYDVLFQDVDIVWLTTGRDPLDFFQDDSSKFSHFDVIFQHDGSNTLRYAPYSANSGFYYARANKKTQYLFTSLLYHSDLIMTWDSHQQVLIQLLSEHSSLFGLNVKVLSRDTEMFPGGFHYHRRKNSFMMKFVKGETDSYIFHMSWTENKDNKVLFLRQLGEWYVTDKCIGKSMADIIGIGSSSENSALVLPCCATEPIFSCHYRDKPSKLPCKSSDPLDPGGQSFW